MRLVTTLIVCCIAVAAHAKDEPSGEATGLRAEYFQSADLKKSIASRLHPGPWLDDADRLAFHDGRPEVQSVRWTGNLHVPAGRVR